MHARHLFVAFALMLAPLSGCITPTESAPNGDIGFQTLDQGPDSGIEERRTVVVRNQSSFEDLWSEHTADEEGDSDIPNVDFDERIVAGIFKGESPDGCHGAEVENVTGDGEQITVEGAFFEVTDAYCTQQITYPFHIVAFERHEAEVTFDVEEETRQRGEDETNDTDDDSDDGSDDGGDGSPAYACREPSTDEASTGEGNVSFETLEEGDQSQIHEACVTVAWNQTAWRDLWRDHHGASTADDQRPAVHFDESIVVAVFKGESSDACHGAEIEEITPEGENLVVRSVLYEVTDRACAEVVTYPFHIVEVERPQGEVRFDVREETR